MPCLPQPCQTARALGRWPDCGKLSGSVKHGPASEAVFVGRRCVSVSYRQSENVHPLVARAPCYSVYIPVTACAPCYSVYIQRTLPVTACTSSYSVCSLLQRVHPSYAPRYSVWSMLQRVHPITAYAPRYRVYIQLQRVLPVTSCTSSYSVSCVYFLSTGRFTCSLLQRVHPAYAPRYSVYIQLQRVLPVTACTHSYSICPRYIVYIQLQRELPVTAGLVPTFCLQALSPAFNSFKIFLVMPPFSAPFLRPISV